MWLEKAIYPVTIDPTFGYTTIGSAYVKIAQFTGDYSIRAGDTFTLSEVGTLDSLHGAFGDNGGGGESSLDLCLLLYREDSAGSGQHDRVAYAEKLNENITSNDTEFRTFTASGENLTADDYVLAALGNGADSTGRDVYIAKDDTTTRNRYYTFTTGAGGYTTERDEDPWTDDASSGARDYSIYATYSVEGEDTCTYSGTGDWNVNYSDNCVVTSTTYVLGDFNLFYDGAGSFEIYDTLKCDALNGGAGTSIEANNANAVIQIY